ncbi:MAG: hypothetical protein M1827_002955 [Pycnora praestabilis]|nr:MAG: hypothetical protein M1827_002955 [Pycnora praestabilis]
MAFPGNPAGGAQRQFPQAAFAGLTSPGRSNTNRSDDPQFDIFEWFPQYQSCQRYFLDHAQHSGPVQAVAAFLNISLPYQRSPVPVTSSFSVISTQSGASSRGFNPNLAASVPSSSQLGQPWMSLVPYLRRLVVTGLDFPGVLHGFFGDDWVKGVGPLHEQERRNYLFAAKSGGWASVKRDYDMLPLETVPFLRPLQGPVDAEIQAAEKSWSEWLAMEDWMVGPRAPPSGHTPPNNGRTPRQDPRQ